MALIFAQLDANQVHAYSLVLSSAGIQHTIQSKSQHWNLEVASEDRRKALRAISLYLSENAPRHASGTKTINFIRSFSAVYAALILLAFHLAIRSETQRHYFFEIFGANARLILDGQIYRCLTALLLHSGWPHLFSNMAGAIVFGTFVASLYGWGIGWLLIVLSGVQGNLLSAFWYGGHHLAVGASTAIFGAVGISAATAFWLRRRDRTDRLRSWAPLAGGLALVAWLGTSPNSDMIAHLTGFMSGVVFGVIYCLWARGRILSRSIQFWAGLTIAVLIAASWYWGKSVS